MRHIAIEELAKKLGQLHFKETTGTTRKWEKFSPSERSLWRLMARAALEAVELHPEQQGA